VGTSISLGARLCHLAARLAHSSGCNLSNPSRDPSWYVGSVIEPGRFHLFDVRHGRT